LGLLALMSSAAIVVAGCGQGGSGGGGAGGGGGSAAKAAAPPATPVFVRPVKTGDIGATVEVVGNLMTLFDVNLSPVTAGKLVNVFVREGDPVRAGEIVAQIDPTTADAEVRQDQADLLSDIAKVGQAQAQYDEEETNAKVAIANAESALSSSKTTLQKTIVGDVPQVKQEAQDQVLQQQANYQNALDAYNREQILYNAGAVALADLQNAEATYNVQKALLDSYKQNLTQELQGGRPEDVETAKQTVVQNQQNLANAYAEAANIEVDKQAIVAAQATVAQGRAALQSAEQDLANTNLVSPIDGSVATRSADPGQIAQPGTSVLEIVDLSTMYYQPTVSEDQFDQISIGQTVEVNADAYPGRTFYGKVSEIYPAASTTNRQFSIRVNIPNPTKTLRPGMYARGTITTIVHHNVVLVPVAAMLPQAAGTGYEANTSSNGLATGGTSLPPQMVFVVGPGNKAEERDLTLGIVNGTEAEVLSGLSAGDPLIVKGEGELQDGDPVSVGKRTGRHGAGGGGAGVGGAGAAGNAGAAGGGASSP
jgi:HlyD family secretion protein